MSDDLKPCAHCGGEAAIKRGKTVMVSCTKCTATTFQSLSDKDSAIVAWNRRATSGAASGEVASTAPGQADTERDAARYRFMRSEATGNFIRFAPYGKPDEIDAAIDAAIAALPKENEQ